MNPPAAAVSTKTFKEAKKNHGLSGMYETTSKVWQDFNVHKAFQKSIKVALDFAYGKEDSEDDDE